MSRDSPQRMMIISPRRWLLSVSLVNVLISYCTYTTASHSVKNMDTDSTKHGPTYTVELNSLTHFTSVWIQDMQNGFFFFFSDRQTWPWPGQSLLCRTMIWNTWPWLCRPSEKTQNKTKLKKTIISAIAIHYFGISWIAFRAVWSFLVSLR